MKTVFLSYSSRDYFFAEMLALKLAEHGFAIWRDVGSIRAGDDWRQTIEEGIKASIAVVVALGANSAQSAYVTYEWAYAMGMEKPVIPVKLSNCKMHPKLEPTQYIDFSYPRALPWDELIQRLEDIETETDSTIPVSSVESKLANAKEGTREAIAAILEYLNKRGFTMASFEVLREKLNLSMSDEEFDQLISDNPAIFRRVKVKRTGGPKPGIAKRVP